MTFTLEEVLVLLAFEAKVIDIETVQAALGITRREVIEWESAAVEEGRQLAEERAAA